MKQSIILILTCITMLACSSRTSSETEDNQTQLLDDHVEVLYFHGKQRCVTCRAIEEHTKELLEQHYAEQMENGQLCMKIIDISKKENEEIADKYQVTWSSLILVQYKYKKETADNLTEFAFAKARSNPEEYKEGLSEKIDKALE